MSSVAVPLVYVLVSDLIERAIELTDVDTLTILSTSVNLNYSD